MQSDRRLVRLVREGYESAFEEIVRRYGRPLDRYAGAIVGSRAEDVTQDAFSKALLALRRDDVEIELRPWLYRIVRNTALNDLRDRPPAAAELAEAIAGGESPAERVEQREELAELMERLRALPEPQRAAIVMRELEGLSHDEIAAALGMSGGAARQAIYRARRALRDAAGMLVPLPLLKAVLAAESPAAAEAAGTAAGLAGAGMAVKATAATVLVAGTVGAGVAIQDVSERREDDRKARATVSDPAARPAATGLPSDGGSGRSGSGGGGSSNSGPGGGDDDRDGEGRETGSEREDEERSDRSGRRSGELDDDRSGPSGDGDSGSDDDSLETVERDRSGRSGGSTSSGSGSSGSGSSGSSGSDDGSSESVDNSGSGSYSSGSSGSGSGSGDSETVESGSPEESSDSSGSDSESDGSDSSGSSGELEVDDD
jgi:RNA polymerase sigma factor (sigma-70 family)